MNPPFLVSVMGHDVTRRYSDSPRRLNKDTESFALVFTQSRPFEKTGFIYVYLN